MDTLRVVHLNTDIKFNIASNDIEVWIQMALYDPVFYAFSMQNAQLFKDIFTKHEILDVENKCTRLFGRFNSNRDLPAITTKSGIKYWYYDGKLHRDNLPAVIWPDGEQHWYIYGKRNRKNDLPTIIRADGVQQWYVNGKLHRDNDLPAIIFSNGKQHWYVNGIFIK